MGKLYMQGADNGIDPSVITALPQDIKLGLVGLDVEGEPIIGTMPINTIDVSLNAGSTYNIPLGYTNGTGKVTANGLSSQTSGTATANDLLINKTAWVNGIKITGNVVVQSILSFSTAPYSSSELMFTWTNPSKGAFSGVIIVGKTDGYPVSISDGTRFYKGFGNNVYPNGISTVILSGFTPNVTYYFRAFSYTTLNNNEWVSDNTFVSNARITLITSIITTSRIFTVPDGVYSIEVFLVGGGGAGGDGGTAGSNNPTGSGGGGGYTSTTTINVTPGQQFSVIIGSGASGYLGSAYSNRWANGGITSFGSISVLGGYGGVSEYLKHSTPSTDISWFTRFSDGGSGGGGGGMVEPDTRDHLNATPWGVAGGSDGNNGASSALYNIISVGKDELGYGNEIRLEGQEGGRGQGSTTRAFGDPSGTVYGSGGGGAGGGKWSFTNNGTQINYGGGTGSGGPGGGRGGNSYDSTRNPTDAMNGTANTGGGGGGGTGRTNYKATRYSGAGGSGICIVRYVVK